MKKLSYIPVAQEVGGPNPELYEWTAQTSAPLTLGGMGFDVTKGVTVDLFCDCSGGMVEFNVTPLSSTSIGFLLPASGPNAPTTGRDRLW